MKNDGLEKVLISWRRFPMMNTEYLFPYSDCPSIKDNNKSEWIMDPSLSLLNQLSNVFIWWFIDRIRQQMTLPISTMRIHTFKIVVSNL